MCIPTRTIVRARDILSDEKCPDCGKPVATHPLPEETGFEFLYKKSNTVLKLGDVLLTFKYTIDAKTFAKRPFIWHPMNSPTASVTVVGSMAGKKLREVLLPTLGTYSEYVVIMRNKNAPVFSKPTHALDKKTEELLQR